MPVASFLAIALTAQVSFSKYQVSPDLHEIANLKTFEKDAPLDREHREKLTKNLFVVAPADNWDMQSTYGMNDYANIPSLVTTDTVLHVFHLAFDATLRTAETTALYPRACSLTQKMIKALSAPGPVGESDAQKEARLHALAYFGVADRLFGLKTPMPAAAKALVDREMQLINDKRGFEDSAIMPSKIDYTQFIVRGHYTKTPTLGRYFLGMMWFGLAPMEIRDKDGNPREAAARMAVVIADTMKAQNLMAAWQGIYEPTTLYAGTVNSLTPGVVAEQRAAMPGAPDKLNWRAFVDALAKKDPAMYKANIKYTNGVAQGVQVKFMGQRGLLDGWVFSRVTDLKRPMPSGLDVMVALGSNYAKRETRENPEAFNWDGWTDYHSRQDETIARFAAVPAADWTKNLYMGWLNVLKAKVATPPHAVPAFMKSMHWEMAALEGALASWAQLRHDTILYGEQTAVEMGDGDEDPPPYVRGFVEPNLPLYDRLMGLVKMLRTELVTRKLVDAETRKDMDEFMALLIFLRGCAQKEVNGTPLTKAEHLHIRHIEGDLDNIVTDLLMKGLNYNTLTEDDRDMALIADVHTADPLALEVACGHSDELIAVVPIEGKLYLARGPVFSYYEFKVPVTERMTDQQWKAKLNDEHKPVRPAWTMGFRARNPARVPDGAQASLPAPRTAGNLPAARNPR